MFSPRKFLLIFALLLLGGCSSTTFIYNRLDFILPWYLDDYVELNRAQDEFAGVTVPSFLNAGFKCGIFSGRADCGCSSTEITVSPLRVFAVTSAISPSNAPLSAAFKARSSEAKA